MKYLFSILSILLLSLGAKAQTPNDSLAVYLRYALTHSPSLRQQQLQWKAQLLAAYGAGQLQDPELSVGVFPMSMEHANVRQLATVTLMQMFPWPGTLKAGRQQMERQAEAAWQQVRKEGLTLAYEVERQWWTMLSVQRKLQLVRQKRDFMDEMGRVALMQYRSALANKNARLSDQLRVEAEVARLDEQMESMKEELNLLKQQFLLTLHRPDTSEVVLPDSLIQQPLPVLRWEVVEAADPTLAQLSAQKLAFEAQERRVRAMGKPMLGVGVEYMVNGRVDMPRMAAMNGKDMFMPMLRVTLPIYRKRTTMALGNARAMQTSVEWGKLKRTDALRSEWLAVRQKAEEWKRKMQLYRDQEKRLQHVLELMEKEYVAGSTQMTDLLQTLRELLDNELLAVEATAQWNIVGAQMIKLKARPQPLLLRVSE